MAMGKMYAFWKYSEFPFICGGIVDKMRADGSVQVLSYGKGNWWKPIKILPEAAGEALHQKIRELKVAHDNALSEVKISFRVKLGELLPEAVK